MIYVQYSGASEESIIAVFAGPQDPEVWPNLGMLEDDDPRYVAFMHPPRNILADQSEELQKMTQLATAQKLAVTNRISVLNDAIELEIATPEEEAELPVRTAQLKKWKTYAVLLGRVTGQPGWPPEVEWPVQPTEGMDLTVSVTTPDTI